ncbi:DUF1642 domain-containing protein [Streptococcus sp. SS9]|uniref:DUF1642 domain-containing protein n=1 Tax=Streptococcus sp. SS9 TaxID=3018255 RepID=UPI00263F5929|nr:DUF1642 domain-containing protein [Streptococcus sp. SS9]MDN5038738.1 DUF1642 domain-containing protein [Streptococcus sp. SS9]
MTRNEAVQKLATAGRLSIAHAEDLYDSFFPKPVVSQCVADWYEGHKDEFEINLYREVCRSEENYNCGGLTDFQEWLISGKTNPLSVLVNMHQFGYEVEKEPKYEVRIKGIDYKYCVLKNGDYWYFGEDWVDKKIKTQSFTRKELEEAGFGWVFDCPGVEVKEVDDGND